MRNSPILSCALILVMWIGAWGSANASSGPREREIAATFAPIFYQGLGDKPRSDYITNFNFDGDWRGDNNWVHADDQKFPLQAYVYYAVAETATHFFIHYAVFHPRDYKGGERRGAILSELMREGARRGGKYDPTGMAEETSLAHENDMEGCLVVVAKDRTKDVGGQVEFVETMAHNKFIKYVVKSETADVAKAVKIEGQRAALYIEPKGHGIEAFDETKVEGKKFLTYRFSGRAQDPTKENSEVVGYDLISLDVLWNKAAPAKGSQQNNATYGAFHKYGTVKISLAQPNNRVTARQINLGNRGAAFLGRIGGINMARPPWAWFDRSNREQLGQWFFDPASVVKRDFKLPDTFSTTYVRPPFWAPTR